jgi:hypothetical protein
MKLFNYFGGRKSIFAFMLFLLVTTFFLLGKCNFDQWGNFCIWIFGTYSVGNGVELLTKIKKPKNE